MALASVVRKPQHLQISLDSTPYLTRVVSSFVFQLLGCWMAKFRLQGPLVLSFKSLHILRVSVGSPILRRSLWFAIESFIAASIIHSNFYMFLMI